MKLTLFSLALGIVASTVNVNALPTIVNQVTALFHVSTCFSQFLLAGSRSDDCVLKMAVDTGVVKGIVLESLLIDFTGPNPLMAKISSKSLKVHLVKVPGPIAPNYPITSTKEDMILNHNGVDIATFNTDWASATVDTNSVLTTTVGECDLKIIPEQQAAFSTFINLMIMSSTIQEIMVKGIADSNYNLFGREVALPGFGFSAPLSFAGMDGFSSIAFVRTVTNGWDGRVLTFSFEIKIINPSQITIEVGDLSFNTFTGMEENRVDLGVSVFKDTRLAPGDNVVQVTTVSSSFVNAQDFIQALKTGGGFMVFEGYAGTSKNKVIADAFVSVKMRLNVPL